MQGWLVFLPLVQSVPYIWNVFSRTSPCSHPTCTYLANFSTCFKSQSPLQGLSWSTTVGFTVPSLPSRHRIITQQFLLECLIIPTYSNCDFFTSSFHILWHVFLERKQNRWWWNKNFRWKSSLSKDLQSSVESHYARFYNSEKSALSWFNLQNLNNACIIHLVLFFWCTLSSNTLLHLESSGTLYFSSPSKSPIKSYHSMSQKFHSNYWIDLSYEFQKSHCRPFLKKNQDVASSR